MALYCEKCHCILINIEDRDVGIANETIFECPKCKYKIVKWRKK